MEGNDTCETMKEAHNLGNSLGSSIIQNVLAITVLSLIIFKFYAGATQKARLKVKQKHASTKEKTLPGPEVLPGPSSWDPTGIIGMLFQLLPIEKSMDTGMKWSELYGDVLKFTTLNQTWVMMNSGPTVQSLCKSADMGHLEKSPMIYDLLKPFINNGVLVSKGKFWQHERRILLKSQAYQSLKAYMPLLTRHCKIFVSGLKELFEDGKPHEINGLISSSFIKVICEIITGYDGDQSNEYDQFHENFQIKIVISWKECYIHRILKPWFLIRPIWKLNPMSWRNDKAVEEMFEFARRRIREHKEKRATTKLEKECDDDDGQGIRSTSSESGFRSVLDELVDGGVDEEQIVDEINTMLFGGHETGATTIHFFCFCMALHPEIQKECQKEIDELFEDPNMFKNGAVTFEAVSSNLKLVERCILETLRLFPPVFFFFRKLLSPLTINYKGQDVLIPPGTNAFVSPYSLHRRPEEFPEPERFDPDRFLPEECTKRHPYAFVPFSAGPRNCLGMKFAMIEMKTIAAFTLRHFTITTKDRMGEIPLLPYITTTPAKDYTFQFTRRKTINI